MHSQVICGAALYTCDTALALNPHCASLEDHLGIIKPVPVYEEPFADQPLQQTGPINKFQATLTLTAIISRQERCHIICQLTANQPFC